MEHGQSIVKKLREIFSLGYTPSRRGESYFEKTSENEFTKDLCNCFGHACFNLKNKHYKEYNISAYERIHFQGINSELDLLTKEEASKRLLDYIRNVGLMVERCPKEAILKSNQWKVALFFDEIYFGELRLLRDYHFMLQESDKSWSSKISYTEKVEKLEELPENYNTYYTLYDIYSITNPNAKLER